MVHLDASLAHAKEPGPKGLKSGALGLVSSVVVGVASTAPAYSLAATLGFVVIYINGLQAPIITILAFIPMLLISFAYKELNYADPDCGTTFTWGTRAFGPKTGWFGGWGIVAADILVMASLAQIAGQYVFLLFGAGGIGSNASSGWVLLVGVLWILLMTAICYIGIELSANSQKVLLGIELTILIIFSVVALIKVGSGHAPPSHLTPSAQWFNPFHVPFTSFMIGFTLMLFIYWGWDTSVSVNEETKDSRRTPGRAAVISTVILLVTYALVVMASQSYAGIGTHGIGLGNSNNEGDVINVLGTSVFGTSGIGWFMTKLLLLMVLSSAAASTQTTILPTARTTLSMATYKAIPDAFGKVHKRFLTPTVSTLVMGGVSVVLYVILNYQSHGSHVISDSVTALGPAIAFYYGLTGFACVWYFRKSLSQSARNLWVRGILPLVGAVILWFAMFWFLRYNWVTPSYSYTTWTIPGTHRVVGGVIILDIVMIVIGVVLFFVYWSVRPSFFRGEVLNRDTPTLVPEDLGTPVGLFGVEPFNGDSPDPEGSASSPSPDEPAGTV
jgi:amino acid transporter